MLLNQVAAVAADGGTPMATWEPEEILIIKLIWFD